jgi:hypothetical protein
MNLREIASGSGRINKGEIHMKYVKMLGLAAIAAAALMAFVGAGSASAAELTCPPGTTCPVGTTFHAVSGTEAVPKKAVLDAPFGNIECNSTVHGHVTSSNPTIAIEITSLIFNNCGSDTVTTLATGTLGITNIAGTKDGTVTSTGAKVTVEHIGTHCIFETSSTDIGRLTGTTSTGGTPVFDISATIPRVGGRSGAFCGSSAPWTGSYSIDAPMSGDVDA